MNTNLPYIIDVSIAITIFYLAYFLLFSKVKMFVFNRIYLVTSMLISFIIPFIPFTEHIIMPATEAIVSTAPVSVSDLTPLSAKASFFFSWQQLLYIFGLSSFLVILITGHIKVLIIIGKSSRQSLYGHSVLVTQKDIPPFTYFNKLIIPSKIINTPHIQSVIYHEDIHKKELHCIDILLMEIMFLFQWFNPFAWLMRKAVRDNLEFLTDEKVTGIIDKNEYQLGIVSLAGKNTFYTFPSLSNQSQLKKRIIMMTKNKQSRFQWIRTLAIIPMLALMTVTLSGREIQVIVPEASNLNTTEDKTIKGTVTDENGQPVINAIIMLKGSKTGTVTKTDGTYSLSNIPNGSVLLFQMFNYDSKEVAVNNQNVINVQLKKSTSDAVSDDKSIEFDAKKYDKHYFIIDGKAYKEVPKEIKQTDIAFVDVYKGQVAIDQLGEESKNGLVIITTKKETTPTVTQFDLSTLTKNVNNSNNQPIIIVDGKQGTSIKNLDPNTIKSMTVLKDAAAYSVYGEEGKNGVVLIKTKE